MFSVFAGIAKTSLVKDFFFLGKVIFKLSIKVMNTSAWPRFFFHLKYFSGKFRCCIKQGIPELLVREDKIWSMESILLVKGHCFRRNEMTWELTVFV